MKKNQRKKALELKVKQIRLLVGPELDVPRGGTPTTAYATGCPTGSGCGCTFTCPD